MEELKLEVGQKVWSIQLGNCEVYDKSASLIRCTNGGRVFSYYLKGNASDMDANPSLFESNPFEPKLVQESKNGWIEPKENKAEMINVLRLIYKDCFDTDIKIIAKDKLQKLLESL